MSLLDQLLKSGQQMLEKKTGTQGGASTLANAPVDRSVLAPRVAPAPPAQSGPDRSGS